MTVHKARACSGGGQGGFLCVQHHFIKRTLRARKRAVGRKCPGDVAGIAIEFAARIDQHQFTCLNGGVVGAIVQHTGVGTGGHDGAVGRVLRAVLAKFVQQFGIQVVFAHLLPSTQPLCTHLHGPNVGARADVRGAAHQVLLVGVFDHAHVVQQHTHIALGVGATGALTHFASHGLQPFVHAGFQAGVHGKGVPHGGLVFQQLGQLGAQLRHGVSGLNAQGLRRGIGAQANAVPNLALHIFRVAKQGAVAVATQHQPSIRLGKAGQVMKITVKPKQVVVVAVAGFFSSRGDDGHAVLAQLSGQSGTSFSVNLWVHRVLSCGAGSESSGWSCEDVAI